MFRKSWVVLSAVVIVSASVSTALGEELTKHVDVAERLVKDLNPEHNEYAYKEPAIKWKGDAGVDQAEARCDCSGFVTLLLEHVYGYTPGRMKKWMGQSRPVARVYHDQIEAGHGFVRIETISQIRRGDLIAVKYLADSKEPGKVDTGHVMVVVGPPRRKTATAPIEPGTTQWEVTVIDSSKTGHGAGDTRRKPDKTFNNGVGEGTLRLYGDREGKIAGYTWSTLAKSEFYPPDRHHVVVGRLDGEFKP